MHRYVLGAVLALGTLAGYAADTPREASEPSEAPTEEQPPSTREPDRENEPAPREPARVSLEDATAIVRQAYGGRVVSSSRATARPAAARPKQPGYRVRVDIEGRVKTVFVDDRGRIHENPEF
ncbi:MAG: hypothetical protein F4029_10010 [Gammaproteobacteria bacterium]|nr:hypothetical protein [Gammaproteobacteria bacterium]MYF30214.1 hypothetical protein [Gammaproteobacteria bacterium]MYK46553.1 hypothetical protein [Gammaproteobacteria bacterium]